MTCQGSSPEPSGPAYFEPMPSWTGSAIARVRFVVSRAFTRTFWKSQGTRQKPGNTVSLIDLKSFRVAKTVVTAAGAHGVVVDREGRLAYVTNTYANSVSVIDMKDRRVTKTVPVGKAPNGISITP